jgi:Spy/CpxP family protein refolding chaperone
MLKKTALIAAIAIVAASAAVAHPHRGRDGREACEGREGARRMMIERKLDLTDTQKKEIEALREKQRESMQSLRGEMQKKAVAFRDLRDANDARAVAVRDEMRAIREEMEARRLAHRADVEKLLSPEQRKELDDLKAARRDRMRDERPGRQRR